MTEAHRVCLYGDPIAVLQRTEVGFALTFESLYRRRSPQPLLGQWFVDKNLDKRLISKRMPMWFANLLPEGWLRTAIEDQAGADHDEFHLLSIVGADLPGAATIEPLSEIPTLAPVRGDTQIAESQFPGTMNSHIRWSLAGVQPKLSVLRDERVTVPLSGKGGQWILKLPDLKHPLLPEVEHAMMTWAKATGLDVPDVDLIPLEEVENLPSSFREQGASHGFLCRRFDRPTMTAKIHQEDFAQILNVHPDDKYGDSHGHSYIQIGRIIRSAAGEGEALRFIARLTFDMLCGNGDSHLKNWTLVYPDRVLPRLAPCYDIVSTILYDGYFPKFALTLMGTHSMHAFTELAIREFAHKIRVSADAAVDIALETARRARSVLPDLLCEVSLTDQQRKRVIDHTADMMFGR